jgi:hypothetical protein
MGQERINREEFLKMFKDGRRVYNHVNLNGINLSNMDLSGLQISKSNLRGAILCGCNLRNAYLRNSDLELAYLRNADLRFANLQFAKLTCSVLEDADLRNSDLNYADLTDAYLVRANLEDASLYTSNLRRANLTGCKGLRDQLEWMKDNFEQTTEGFLVFTAIDKTDFPQNPNWEIKSGKTIEDPPHFDRTQPYGAGVNFATFEFINKEFPLTHIWKALIKYEDLANLCVPYNTKGQARCAKLYLIDIR